MPGTSVRGILVTRSWLLYPTASLQSIYSQGRITLLWTHAKRWVRKQTWWRCDPYFVSTDNPHYRWGLNCAFTSGIWKKDTWPKKPAVFFESVKGIAGCEIPVLPGVFQCIPIARQNSSTDRERLVLMLKMEESVSLPFLWLWNGENEFWWA